MTQYSDEGKESLLFGILLDVSGSMKENWKNKTGRSFPRIQVIQKTVHDYLQRLQDQPSDDEDASQTDLFALGFGFREVTPYVGIDGSSLQTTIRREDVICDLLALAELVPNQEKLDDFHQGLNSKWKRCAGTVFDKATIKENVFEGTRDFIHTNMRATALAKLHPPRFQNEAWPLWLQVYGRESHKQKEERIRVSSAESAQHFVESLKASVDKEFQKSRATYTTIIQDTMHKFVASFVETTLQAMVLGFSIPEIVETLDEKEANKQASEIYEQLERAIRLPMKLAIAAHQQLLFHNVRNISATLDKQEIKEQSEKFVKKFFWDTLYPLIQGEIQEMFSKEFHEQLRGSLYHWIELAAAREVSRPLHQISSLLPDTVDEELYSERVMFGATPFRKALDLAGARMIDPRYDHHQKVLLVISDGVFDEDSSILVVAEMLKRRGVTIVSAMIHPQNFLQRLFPRGVDHWPEGAKKMFAVASDTPEEYQERPMLEKIQTPGKFFYHVNNTEILDELLDIFLMSGTALENEQQV